MSEKNVESQFYSQLSESVQSIFELSTRIDERVLSMMKKQEEFEEKVEKQNNSVYELSARVKVLESKNGSAIKYEVDKMRESASKDHNDLNKEISNIRMQLNELKDFEGLQKSVRKMETEIASLKKSAETHDNIWKTIFDYVLRGIWLILGAYLLYKFGLQAPSL